MTMSRFESLARRLVLFLGLGVAGVAAGGCDGGPTVATMPAAPAPAPATPATPDNPPAITTPPPGPATQAAIEADVADHLARLKALETVEVGALVVFRHSQAPACYGECPDDVLAAMTRDAYAHQAPRLARLTELAETIVRGQEAAPADPTGAAADLAALNALRIVDFKGLLMVAPVGSPSTYNVPTPADVARANTENQRRAGIVHELAREAATQKL